jgi:hypothetical protein
MRKVDVHVYDPMPEMEVMSVSDSMRSAPSMSRRSKKSEAGGLRFDEVRVVNQEAVGMYEVAVLEAGSAFALKRWMSDNDFRYPTGMDRTVNDYVDQGWVFTTVKTKVGQMPGVQPRAGMKKTRNALPKGSSFHGHVQAMGFRFESDEPVVPMRLSTFNGTDTHNLIYVLAEKPVRMNAIDTKTVVRQVNGTTLHTHLTAPLEVSVHNGTAADIGPEYDAQIKALRNPTPYVKAARDVISADLLAVRGGDLTLPFEEAEKELLRINEALGLRDKSVDAMLEQQVTEHRERATRFALDDLREMTLTVIEGDLPREYIQAKNVTFDEWTMDARRNHPNRWTRRPAGPSISVPRAVRSGWSFPW